MQSHTNNCYMKILQDSRHYRWPTGPRQPFSTAVSLHVYIASNGVFFMDQV